MPSAGSTTCPLNTTEITRLATELDQLHAAGGHAFIDVHNFGYYFIDGTLTGQSATPGTGYRYAIGSATIPQAAYADFWSRMTSQFLGHPALLGFHIMNEPVGHGESGALTRSAWYSASQAAVTAIRAVDTAGSLVIRVGGWFWSDCIDWAANNPSGTWITDPVGGPVWYEAHHYFSEANSGAYTTYANAVAYAASLGYTAGSHPDALYSKIIDGDLAGFASWLGTYGVPGIIGECNIPHNGGSDQASWDALLAAYLPAAAGHGIPVECWSCGEIYAGTDPLNAYVASVTGSNSATGVDTQLSTAATWEASL
jgi:endoglucanase